GPARHPLRPRRRHPDRPDRHRRGLAHDAAARALRRDTAGRRDRHRPRLRRGDQDARRLAPLAQGHRRPRRLDVACRRQRPGRVGRRVAAGPAARHLRQELRADAARLDRGRPGDRRRDDPRARAVHAQARRARAPRGRSDETHEGHGRADRRRPRSHPRRDVGRQRRLDRPGADPRLSAHAAPRRRHGRLSCRDPAVGRGRGALGQRQRRLPADGDDPDRLAAWRRDRHAADRPRPGERAAAGTWLRPARIRARHPDEGRRRHAAGGAGRCPAARRPGRLRAAAYADRATTPPGRGGSRM
ncbi:MAG: membrane protein, putative, partial [uncultured Solirubrobacteraceae bacterium]